MSVDLDNFGLSATLVNGHMRFGYEPPDKIAAFLAFAVANPDHVYVGDGMEYPCSLLVERYIEPGKWSSLVAEDLERSLRHLGWLRDDGDGERMHTTRSID